ncbi:MAG TPA: chloride channel protein [Trueperaceae bacterium]|nr:chloride channel protein [Trueperaceae bacterium]
MGQAPARTTTIGPESETPAERSKEDPAEDESPVAQRGGRPQTDSVPAPGVSLRLTLYSLLVGIIAGLGAVAFRGLIALFHNLFFFGHASVVYDTLKHTAESSWGVGVIAVPVVGALLVAFLVKTFAPEAKGHGVPEVIDAIYYNGGRIRPVVAVIKSLASSISIGSGGSVGREGPIIQIGATFGSVLGQWARMPEWKRLTLIACGAGGGIAATFNTPIGGILFAVEIMLVEISARSLVPVMIATGAASFIGRLFFGADASFLIPSLTLNSVTTTALDVYGAYAVLGVVMGFLAVLYTRSIYAFEDAFDRLPVSYYVRHAFGMLLVGLSMFLLYRTLGHYYIQGVGYATIQDILNGGLTVTWILLVLLVAKLLAVSLTLGSGASGGIFSPALFMGATLGAGLVQIGHSAFPNLAVSLAGGAVIGMACMVAASTGAAVTAVVMIFEMTRDYNVIIPLIIAVSIAYAVRRWLLADSIYTLKLTRRGRIIPASFQSNLYLMRDALELIQAPFLRLDADSRVDAVKTTIHFGQPVPHVVLVRKGEIVSIVPADILKPHLRNGSGGMRLADLADGHYTVIDDTTQVVDLIGRLRAEASRVAVLVSKDADPRDPNAVVGIVSWGDLMQNANLPTNLSRMRHSAKS